MDRQPSEILEKIRQQFDFGPYPRIPVERSPKEETNTLFMHNLVTAYYLRYQKVVEPKGKLILDAGCGSGYKALILAEANPGAKIIGIDLSSESVKLSQERLKFHGVDNAEFYTLALEEVGSLGLKFDYINCDETLYLTEDPKEALKALGSVLQPQGIIRTNLHSSIQRQVFYRAQEVFKLIGLMDENPEDEAIDAAVDFMKSLKSNVDLKTKGWNPNFEGEDKKTTLLSNHLLMGDKGYTIPQLFEFLREAQLEFIEMVNWRHWDLTDLFADPEELPAFFAMGLDEATQEEKLHLFELLHPRHRLLDFWCGYPLDEVPEPIEEWQDSDWYGAWVHLHPQLKTDKVKAELIESIEKQIPFEISRYMTMTTNKAIHVESGMASCLLPLWEAPQALTSLRDRWLTVKPLNPVTLEPMSEEIAFDEVRRIVKRLEAFFYVLVERA